MRKFTLAALVVATACTSDTPTMPGASSASAASAGTSSGYYPGWRLTPEAEAGKLTMLNCTPRVTSHGSAVIGPRGGVLLVGPHKLVVPAGALRRSVTISGTVPEGKPFEIDLQPHGLQFHKAAGLVLDASSCTDVPTIVYLVDQVSVSPPIKALYSTWWMTIACPIWHFSGYAIAFNNSDVEDAGSAH
jgi:hypothetical protein